MRQLLPIVHHLLILHIALRKKYIDDVQMLHKAITFKLFADLCAGVGDGDIAINLVEIQDFRSLIGLNIPTVSSQ